VKQSPPKRRVRGPWNPPLPAEILRVTEGHRRPSGSTHGIRVFKRLPNRPEPKGEIWLDEKTWRLFDSKFAEWYKGTKRTYRDPVAARFAFIMRGAKRLRRTYDALGQLARIEARDDPLTKVDRARYRAAKRMLGDPSAHLKDGSARRVYGIAFARAWRAGSLRKRRKAKSRFS
jgi:YD repeat-containing protein